MKRLSQKIYHISLYSVQFIILFLTILLFVSNFLFTCYAENMETQVVCTRWDNLLLNLFGSFLLCIFFVFVAVFVAKKGAKWKKLLLFITLGWIVALGAILILFGKTVPAADAMSVYGAAGSLAEGNTSVIHPTDSYLSYYPQQVGLMAFLEVLIRIWNLLGINVPAYHFIKGTYVLLLCVAVLFQYKSVHLLWENDTTDCLYLLLAGSNLPMIMYSSFVYGEIPSFTAFSVGLYFLLLFIKNPSHLFPGSIGLLFLTLSVMLRKNSLILIIAVCLVLLLEWVRIHRCRFALLAALCAMAALLILPCVQKGYEIRSGNYLRSGVPAMSYVAMGMQESSRGQGWYNGYNINTYQACSMDTALTNDMSLQSIRDSLSRFREDPGYAIDFYAKKFLSQWTDGTYASRQATLATFGGRRPLFQRIYEGDLSAFYIQYCNLYQDVIYLGALLFCVAPYRRKRQSSLPTQREDSSGLTGLPLYIGFIGVIGGFLFHIIWEANSRYIFIYGLLLLPYAAWGLNLLSNTFSLGKFPRNNKYRRPHATDMPATEAQAGQASSPEP